MRIDYRKSRKVLNIGVGVGLAIAVVFGVLGEVIWLGCAGLLLFIASVAQALFFYRCPSCKAQLNIRGKHPKFCPECGVALD